MIASLKQKVERTARSTQWERREAKYIIPNAVIPEFREFIAPYVWPDPHGGGEYPEYTITTIQLDSPSLTLHYAKEEERKNRFKLRIRSYGERIGDADIYLEIKRKLDQTVVKSRATIRKEDWCEDLLSRNRFDLDFKNDKEANSFFEFLRLMRTINAVPKVIIRYDRESYFGRNEDYARVTVDRRIRYRPAHGYALFPQGGHWWPIDTAACLKRNFPGVILELKTYSEVPTWMIAAVREFNLVQTGFCKYSAAMDLESRFTGMDYTDAEDGAFF